MAGTRKTVCVAYETGKNITNKGRDFPETKLLTVGSAFVDQTSGRINGQFRALPLSPWDGRFLILDPLPKNEGFTDDDVPGGM